MRPFLRADYHHFPVAEVRLERVGTVGWLVFDNPERHNAVTGAMLRQVVEAVDEVAADPDVRVLVMRGAGERAFVSGADISGFSDRGAERGPGPQAVVEAIGGLAKPVVAALRGWCLGGGAMLAFAADLRIAGDDTSIGIPAAKLGVAYPRGGIERVVALTGPAVAAELLMLGEPFGAERALSAGLVNRVVPAADVFDEAQQTAEALAGKAPLTQAAAKRAIASVLDPDDAAARTAADEAAATALASDDFKEGQRAFAEKRQPAFRGR